MYYGNLPIRHFCCARKNKSIPLLSRCCQSFSSWSLVLVSSKDPCQRAVIVHDWCVLAAEPPLTFNLQSSHHLQFDSLTPTSIEINIASIEDDTI